MWKKFKSENTNEKIVLKKYTLNKKLLEESSRNVYSEYHVLVSTCSSILNVYVASCFFIKMYIYK
jgi:hypothetical protein